MNTVAECKNYADMLGVIPAFSTCSRDVLEEFVAHGVFTVHAAAGQTLCSQTHCDQNLYVLVAGSAFLDAGDDVRVALEPGDYFGRNPGRHHELIASVVAERDVEFLVIRPEQVAQLEQASSRNRHPSRIEWRNELSTPTPRSNRRRHRRGVLAS